MSTEKKVAVITGASSGIGAGILLSGCCNITVD
jgi:NADP-dependent 3-hydroxy acid dehydrogenase YdfG